MKLNWDGPHMPLLAPMLVVPAGGDGTDTAAADAAAANKVPPPLPPPDDPTLVRKPTPIREPTPSPVREPTTFREPTPEPPRPPFLPPCTRLKEVGPTTFTAGNNSISIEDPLRPLKPWPTYQTSPINTTTLTRPPSATRHTSFQEDISEGGGGYVSSPKSNEAPLTIAATAAAGAEESIALTDLSLKLNRLKGILQQRKRRMVISNSEGEEAATKEHEVNLDALYELASTSLGGDTTVEAAYTIYKTSQDAHASSDAGHDKDETIPAGSTPIPTTRGVSAGSSMDPAGQAADVAPSSSTILAADKGKAPMVDDSIPADLLTEQERVLKNLHDYQFGEDLAKKLQAEQEAEFPRPRPTLEAPIAKRARQGVPQTVHAAASHVPASVLAALSIATNVSVSAVSTMTADVSPAPTLPAESVAEVHANESRPDENKTTFE
nr:hypothetical protein [Tanacetum cinerariifolium]